MNKTYKVVWSKAKSMYVVVSELAKNTTKGCSAKKLLTMLIAAGVMSVGMTAHAAVMDNSLDRSLAIYNDYGAPAVVSGVTTIAVGNEAYAGAPFELAKADVLNVLEVGTKAGTFTVTDAEKAAIAASTNSTELLQAINGISDSNAEAMLLPLMGCLAEVQLL